MTYPIKDAASFYGMIKDNPLYADKDDKEMIEALQEYFDGTIDISNANLFTGRQRDEFLFFQGMLAGGQVMSKIFKHHIAAEAYARNIDPVTGRHRADKENN